MHNFEQVRSHLAAGDFRITMQEPYVLCVELSLDQGRRHQAIFLSELQGEDGREYLRVSTVIAPTTGIDCRRALAFNWESRVGYLAIGELGLNGHLAPTAGVLPAAIAALSRDMGRARVRRARGHVFPLDRTGHLCVAARRRR